MYSVHSSKLHFLLYVPCGVEGEGKRMAMTEDQMWEKIIEYVLLAEEEGELKIEELKKWVKDMGWELSLIKTYLSKEERQILLRGSKKQRG